MGRCFLGHDSLWRGARGDDNVDSLSSSAFPHGAKIPHRYTADGEDLSPPLAISGVPKNAQELALVCDDPDAPTPQPWVHWVIYKIPVETTALGEGIVSKDRLDEPSRALQGKNSWKTIGYRGPAPPRGHGTHHYHFRVFALDQPLKVAPGLDKAGLLAAIKGHVLAEGELIGTYERK